MGPPTSLRIHAHLVQSRRVLSKNLLQFKVWDGKNSAGQAPGSNNNGFPYFQPGRTLQGDTEKEALLKYDFYVG